MRWGFVAFGIGVYAVALAALAPASLVDARLAAATEGRLRLAEARGSVWSGAGWIEVRDTRGAAGIAKPLRWHILPLSLFLGRLSAELQLDDAKPFPVSVSLSGLEISNAALRLPATALGLGLPKLAPFRLGGEVLVDVPQVSVARGRADGNATLRWLSASSALTTLAPLGDYEVRFSASGSALQATLSTLKGPLQLEGKGSWSSNAPSGFAATATVPPQHLDQLAPLFNLFAIQRSPGVFELQLK